MPTSLTVKTKDDVDKIRLAVVGGSGTDQVGQDYCTMTKRKDYTLLFLLNASFCYGLAYSFRETVGKTNKQTKNFHFC